MTGFRRLLSALALTGTLLTGCLGASTGSASPTAFASPTIPFAGTALPPTASPVVLLPHVSPTPQAAIPAAPSVTPSPTANPVELSFPTGEATDSAENRPPLYPVPLAISPHDHFFFARPITANYPAEPLWDFRYGGVYFGPNEVHTGVDLPAPRGAPVVAAGPGTVIWAGKGLFSGEPNNPEDPYGNAVVIRHDFGYEGQPLFTVYAHMDRIDVVLGQWLNTGDQVGIVGSTGFTTGPHLHFEVRLGKNDFFATRNPELWMVPAEGLGVLAGRVMSWANQFLPSSPVYVRNLTTDRKYTVFTYGPSTVNSDDYYQENVVLGDLPAGVYEVDCQYAGIDNKTTVQILPGQVTFFFFKATHGYTFTPPTVTPAP